jgi:hypothetical protein
MYQKLRKKPENCPVLKILADVKGFGFTASVYQA